MPPQLCDPYAGPAGAPGYIMWWGDALYRDWCRETGVIPIGYEAFCARTLELGKDWWADRNESTPSPLGKRAREQRWSEREPPAQLGKRTCQHS